MDIKFYEKRNIVLTGFMGTGKTTVGQLVADYLGWLFRDADEEIERRFGKPIPQIFAEDGEPTFRRYESVVCQSLAAMVDVVIATGGGMLVSESNRELMLKSGFVVCLTATPDELEARLADDDGRPLLKGDWRALLARRQPAYETIPFQVDTTGREPYEIAQEVVWLWRNM